MSDPYLEMQADFYQGTNVDSRTIPTWSEKSTKSTCTLIHVKTRRKVNKLDNILRLWTRKADFTDNMEDWDEAKLRSVVTQQESKQKTSTDVSLRVL